MTRYVLAEQIQRLIYGGFPENDAEITLPLINLYINEGIAVAVKQSYIDSLKMDGVAYLNSSFYTTFKSIAIAKDNGDNNLFVATIPEIPIALGQNEAIADIVLTDGAMYSKSVIPLTIEQVALRKNIRRIPDKIYYWYERNNCFFDSLISLLPFTANIRIASGGADSTDLNAQVYLPTEWIGFVKDYAVKNLLLERAQPKDLANDGIEVK
jgi:hypothetical protein